MLEDRWEGLLGHTNNKSIYQSYKWISTCWEYFGGDGLYLLAASQDDQILGIAPLMVEQMRVKGLPLFRILRFIGSGPSDYLDFILKKGWERNVLDGFIAYLVKDKQSWDIMWLSELPEDSSTNELLPSILSKYRLEYLSEEQSRCPYIELPPTWGEYERTLSRTTRNNVKMYSKRIARSGMVEHKTIDDRQAIASAMDDFFSLHEGRWRDDERGHDRTETIKSFHHHAAVKLSDNLNLYFMLLDNKKIASIYSYDYDSTRYFYWIGWDKDYAHCSPGFIAIANRIEDAIQRGMKGFDFLRGDEPYKYHFTKKEKINNRYFVSNSRLKMKLFLFLEKRSG